MSQSGDSAYQPYVSPLVFKICSMIFLQFGPKFEYPDTMFSNCVRSISSDFCLKTWKNMADRNGFCLFRKTLMHISNSRTLWRCIRNTTPSTYSSGQYPVLSTAFVSSLCSTLLPWRCHSWPQHVLGFRSDLVAVLYVMHLHRTLLQRKALSALDLFDTVCLWIDNWLGLSSRRWMVGWGVGDYT